MNTNSPIKSLLPGLPASPVTAPAAPVAPANLSPAKSQQSPVKNLQNHSTTSIQSLLDQAKLPSTDSNAPPLNSVSNNSTNSLTIGGSPNKTNANISSDPKTHSNDTNPTAPLTNNNTADIKDGKKDSTTNGDKPTTNGVDSSTAPVSASLPDVKTASSAKAPVEPIKEAIVDNKPKTLLQPNVSITLAPAVEPPPASNSVPPVVPTETKPPIGSSNEMKPSPPEPSVDSKPSVPDKTDVTKTPGKVVDPKPVDIKSPLKSAAPPVSQNDFKQLDLKGPTVKPTEPVKVAPGPPTLFPAKSDDKPATEVVATVTEVAATPADEEPDKTENISENTKPAITTEPEATATPVKVDPPVKPAEEPIKTPPAKPKRQPKVTPKAKEETKQEIDPSTPAEDGKPKRARKPVEAFQSPLPELSLVTRLNNKANSEKVEDKEKLVIFYKNEFLAVRNEEGGFYVCQTLQNVFKTSHRIRIRWMSQGPNNEFTPDFYDLTEFDCILTCPKLVKVEKEKWKLTEMEKERVENILKRSLEVEKGETLPDLTEEHPDGLDLSLYRDESQLRKTPKKGATKKSLPAKKTPAASSVASLAKKSDSPVPSTSGAKRPVRATKRGDVSYDCDEPSSSGSDFSVKTPTAKKVKTPARVKTPAAKKVASTPDIVAAKKKAADKTPAKKTPASTSAVKSAAKRKTADKANTPVAKKQKPAQEKLAETPVEKSPAAKTLPAKRKLADKPAASPSAKKQKVEATPPPPKPNPITTSAERNAKTRNAGSAVEAKITSAVTPSRPSRDRRGGASTKK